MTPEERFEILKKRQEGTHSRIKTVYTPIVFSKKLCGADKEYEVYFGMPGKVIKVVAFIPDIKEKQTFPALCSVSEGVGRTRSQSILINKIRNIAIVDLEITDQSVIRVTLEEVPICDVWVAIIVQPTDLSLLFVDLEAEKLNERV